MSTTGVTEYVHATADLYFEPKHVDCDHCPCLETYSRKQCRLTGEYLIDTRTTGYWCPLIIDRKEDNSET